MAYTKKKPGERGLNLRKWHALPWKRSRYKGRAILQTPVDLWLMTELVEQTSPTLFVEVGVNEGGFSAWLLDLFSGLATSTRLLGIDHRDLWQHHHNAKPIFSRSMRFEKLDALDPMIPAEIERLRGDGVVIVFLDDDHSPDHVAAELDHYSGVLHPGDQLIVADSTTVRGLNRVCLDFVGSSHFAHKNRDRFGLSNHFWMECEI